MKLKFVIPMAMLAWTSVGKISAQETRNTPNYTTEEHSETIHIRKDEKQHRSFNIAIWESLILNREENKVIIWGEVFKKFKELGDREIGVELGAVFNKDGIDECVLVSKEELFKIFNTNIFLKQEIAIGNEGVEFQPGLLAHRGFEINGREYHITIGTLMDIKHHMEDHAHRFSGEIGIAVSLLK